MLSKTLWTTKIYSQNFFDESRAFTKVPFWYDPLRLSSRRCTFPATIPTNCSSCTYFSSPVYYMCRQSHTPWLSTLQYYKNVSVFDFCMLYPQKLTLTSPTSGGRSVGIVRSRTQATEFFPHAVLLPAFWARAPTIFWALCSLYSSLG
jgi:hypothetical protein